MGLLTAVGTTFDESVVIQGHKIRFMTVDLTASASDIRAELLRVTLLEAYGTKAPIKVES